MKTLTTTEQLAEFCAEARNHPYVTIDTEFLRERTYYSQLCLLQLAYPGKGDENAVLVDPLVDGMRLDPLYDLFRDTSVVKVFHAARQDLEIFYFDGKVFPKPLFDTQVAAMVCGFGEQVGYETLVKRIVNHQVDKSSRFTDWSRRPLTDAQKEYALADVTHLRGVYEFLAAELKRQNRSKWVDEEIEVLTRAETYEIAPDDAWKRVKTRTSSARFMAIVKELAAFRENYAQTNNVPRSRVFKDDVLIELASTKPANLTDLGRSRLLQREARKGDLADAILAAVARGVAMPTDLAPQPDRSRDKLNVDPALADLLRVLLKAKAEQSSVAQKLIATSSDLDLIAAGERDVMALRGWRGEVFGDDALRLCAGKVALAAKGGSVRIINL
ncbi:ribonuclease D [Pseudoruegeria sp. SK021]|uniref:ribonuclease D n=1 Tax=Pseudoruegeria sp. SK021 TaxID=1933035 RepID=UPI000A24E6A1|nr:ribonuclease D [Pseudoruegeria sp. SK021]OSP56338.1 ribonuclease D [Pseudoruegeria sp. SK021]